MTPQERFWAKVDKTEACWLWTASTQTNGYGQFRYEGTTKRAHRVAWFFAHGSWPESGMVVCHRCDNILCVRPDHLFVAAQRDNVRDAWQKGRGRTPSAETATKGSAHHWAQLTPADVRAIRRLHADGSSPVEIARQYGRDPSHVRQIIARTIWKSVD